MSTQPLELGANWEVPTSTTTTFHDKRHPYALVIPVLNEGVRIRGQLLRLAEAKFPVDIFVADGGSSDGSLDHNFVRSTGVRVMMTKTGPGRLSAQLRMAYAECLREGYQGIVTMDGNGKDGVEAVSLFVEKLREGYDYVQGSRYRRGGRAENTPLDRAVGNRLIHAPLLSIASRRWLTDTTNGFRAYSAAFLTDVRVAPFRDVFENYELLFYLTLQASRLHYRICEVPVRRAYPKSESTPTKIIGFAAKFHVLRQTLDVVRGKFDPDRTG